MISVCRTAVHVCSWFAKHARALATSIAVICIAGVYPLPCVGQTTPWNTNGTGIWYSPSTVKVGIGTTSPAALLEIQKPSTVGLLKVGDGTNTMIWYGNGSNDINTYGAALRLYSATSGIQFRTGAVDPAVVILNSGNVGIGTTAPTAKLHVTGDVQIDQVAAVAELFLGPNKATAAARLQWENNNSRFNIGINAVNYLSLYNGNVGIGTTAPQYKLAVNGTIGAKEVIVTNTGWSDYVFKSGYRLKPLKEIALYIKANHRLPEIPSEAEVKEKGVGVGEMQAKLLAKIEELTLHMIQAEERNDRLERQNRQMQERFSRMERRIAH